MRNRATYVHRAAACAAAAAALVIGLSTVATAAPAGTSTSTAGLDALPAAAGVSRATDPWSPEPVENDLFSQTSQGWLGKLPVGTVETTTMTITAKQDLVLRPSNWYSGSDYFDFALAGKCPSSLFGSARMAPGETCTVTWTMHPHSLISLSAGWSFTATPVDAGGAATGEAILGSHNLAYTSTVFTSENVDFGEVVVGASATKPVTIHNGSAVDAYLAVDAPWGAVTLPERPVEPVLVPAGEDYTFDAVYTPEWVGALSSSSWYHTTLPGDSGKGTDIVRFTGTAVEAAPVPPVDPTDPPVDPTDPPVDPTDPPVDPTDPTEPPVEPTQPAVDPTDPSVDPMIPPVEPTDPTGPSGEVDPPVDPNPVVTVEVAGEQVDAEAPATTITTTTSSDKTPAAAATAGAGSGALASTGASVLSLALGALTVVCLGVSARIWSRCRSARDSARPAL